MFIISVASYYAFTFLTYDLMLVFVNICFGLGSASYIALLAKVLQNVFTKFVKM